MDDEKSPLIKEVDGGGFIGFLKEHWKATLIAFIILLVLIILYYTVINGFIEKTIRSDPSSDFDIISEVAKVNRKQEEYLNYLKNEDN